MTAYPGSGFPPSRPPRPLPAPISARRDAPHPAISVLPAIAAIAALACALGPAPVRAAKAVPADPSPAEALGPGLRGLPTAPEKDSAPYPIFPVLRAAGRGDPAESRIPPMPTEAGARDSLPCAPATENGMPDSVRGLGGAGDAWEKGSNDPGGSIGPGRESEEDRFPDTGDDQDVPRPGSGGFEGGSRSVPPERPSTGPDTLSDTLAPGGFIIAPDWLEQG